jgi:hypothetical protein
MSFLLVDLSWLLSFSFLLLGADSFTAKYRLVKKDG